MAGRTTKRSKPEIKLNSYDDLFGEAPVQADAVEVMTRELHDFENHPFHVKDDEDMAELVQSVRDKGILVPLTVRPKDGEGYEIISGHRRKHAAEIAGLFKVPVLIRELSDEDAVDIMIYSNIQRTNILPSEKARAYRLQMETLKHQGTVNRAIYRIIRDCNDAQFEKNEHPEVLLPHFSCHNLRHTFTTRMVEAGVNIKVIQDALGHKDIQTTMNIYADVTRELKKSEFEGLDGFFKKNREDQQDE